MNAAVRDWLAGLREAGRPDELEVKALLSVWGVAVPHARRLGAGEALGEPPPGGPLAVKVCAADLLHKTEAGAVLLDVARDELTEAVSDLRARFPGRDLLIEEHVAFEPPELIAGALRDRDFGPAVMIGCGGVWAELYRDVAFRLAPCPTNEALHMLGELRVAPVFDGARGARLDGAALAAQISRIADLAVCLGDRLGQLDVNPIVYADRGWVALDAAIQLA